MGTARACLHWSAADLIEGEPDGLHVFALPPFLPAVLLHEADQEAAVRLAGSVRVLQHELELRVEPKGCWEEELIKVRLFHLAYLRILFFGVFLCFIQYNWNTIHVF